MINFSKGLGLGLGLGLVLVLVVLICGLKSFKCLAFEDTPPHIYVSEFVEEGSTLNLTCDVQTQSLQWNFLSISPISENNLYMNGKLRWSAKERYNVVNGPNKSMLGIAKADIFHAGYYECLQGNTAVNTYKLTVVEKANITLIKNGNNDVDLNVNLLFRGHAIPNPFVRCKLAPSMEDESMTNLNCTLDKFYITSCHLIRIYSLNGDLPFSCTIFFINGNRYSLPAIKLSLIKDNETRYVSVGDSLNVTCGSLVNSSSIAWHIINASSAKEHKNLIRTTYNLMIAHVEAKDAGTYECTHQSTPHFIEKKIELVVVESCSIFPSIDLPRKLAMKIIYVGNSVVPTPLFQCISNNKVITLNNSDCHVPEFGLTKCNLNEFIEMDIDTCQIILGNYTCCETDLRKILPVSNVNISINGGQIAGYVVGSIGFVCLIIAVILFVLYQTKRKKRTQVNYRTKRKKINEINYPVGVLPSYHNSEIFNLKADDSHNEEPQNNTASPTPDSPSVDNSQEGLLKENQKNEQANVSSMKINSHQIYSENLEYINSKNFPQIQGMVRDDEDVLISLAHATDTCLNSNDQSQPYAVLQENSKNEAVSKNIMPQDCESLT